MELIIGVYFLKVDFNCLYWLFWWIGGVWKFYRMKEYFGVDFGFWKFSLGYGIISYIFIEEIIIVLEKKYYRFFCL